MQPWYDADVKIYTPRYGVQQVNTEQDQAGELLGCAENEQLSLWRPSHKQLVLPKEDQPYTEP